MNKKGFDFFANVVIIPLIIMIIIAFAIIMALFDIRDLGDKEDVIELNKNIEIGEDKYVILNYLRTSLDSPKGLTLGPEATIADLIYLWQDDTTWWDTLSVETKNIFFDVYGICYGVKIGNEEINPYNYDDKKSSCIELSNGIDVCLDVSKYNEWIDKNKEGGFCT